MKNIFKKLLAMGIALMMVSACVYLPAFAASGDNEENNENIVDRSTILFMNML